VIRRTVDWPAVVTVAAAIALGVFAMNPLPIGAFHDDARYLLLARSIAEGTGYRFVSLPGMPAGTHFPPAFPLLLAALWKVAPPFPASVMLFKLLNALLLVFAAFAAFVFARDRAGLAPWVATGVALAFAGSVPVLFLDGLLFSEPLFIAAMLGALIVAERAVRRPGHTAEGGNSLATLAFVAGLSIGAVTMIRTIGIALGVGIAVTLLRRRQWRELALATAGITLFVAPWQLWTMRHGGEIPPLLSGDYGTYGSWISVALHSEGIGFLARVVEANLAGFRILLVLFGTGGAVQAAVAVTLVIALGFGAARLAVRAPVSVASTVAYLLVVLIWPGTPDRFLWPVWPLLLTGLACGASEISAWSTASARKRLARGAMLAALAVCGLLFVRFNVGMYGSRGWEGPASANAKVGLASAAAASGLPEGLVATEFDGLVSLYTGRRAVPLLPLLAANYLRPRTPDEAAAQLSDILDAYHPRFLLVGTTEALDAARRLAHADPPRIRFGGVTPSGVLLYVPTSP
jgi:hypothetical protein